MIARGGCSSDKHEGDASSAAQYAHHDQRLEIPHIAAKAFASDAAAKHATMMVKFDHTPLTRGTVVNLGIIGSPNEAADAEDSSIFVNVTNATKAASFSEPVSDQIR